MKQMHQKALPVLMAAMILFSGCGSSSVNSTQSAPASPYEGGAQMDNSTVSQSSEANSVNKASPEVSGTASISVDRKLVKTAALNLETKKYEETLSGVTALVQKYGGYIESRQEQGVSMMTAASPAAARYAAVTARIPADRLDEATAEAKKLGNLTSENSSVNDITDSYTDTEARLKSLRLQEERLLAILDKASSLNDVVLLEQSLADVRTQIESSEATLKNMEGQVSYSVLTVSVTEVSEYNLVPAPTQTLGERLADAWQNALIIVRTGLSNVLVWLVTYLPSLLIWAVLLGAAALIVCRFFRKKRGSQKPPIPKAAPQPQIQQQEPPKE